MTSLQPIQFSPTHSLYLDYLPSPTPPTSSAYIFYIHGGGFVSGDRHCVTPFIYGLAQGLNLPLISVDYRLCPENSLEEGCEDVKSAWEFVHSDEFSAFKPQATSAIVVGVSAGSYYALNLLNHIASNDLPKPLAFVNMYGSIHFDVQNISTPKQIPHPLLDQPGGFAPLNALVQQLYQQQSDDDDTFTVQSNLKPCTGSLLSMLGPMKANGFIKNNDEFYNNIWKPNQLSDQLFNDSKAGQDTTQPKDDDFTPLARVMLLIWALRNGSLQTTLNGSSTTTEPIDRQQLNHLAVNDKINSKSFPSTISIHGTNDLLVPHIVSQSFHQVLESKGVDSTLVTIPDGLHAMDVKWIFKHYHQIGTVAGGDEYQKHLEEWIQNKIHTL
ncbi:unnamed protein product [Sympodiomycopsis kandeliae]